MGEHTGIVAQLAVRLDVCKQQQNVGKAQLLTGISVDVGAALGVGFQIGAAGGIVAEAGIIAAGILEVHLVGGVPGQLPGGFIVPHKVEDGRRLEVVVCALGHRIGHQLAAGVRAHLLAAAGHALLIPLHNRAEGTCVVQVGGGVGAVIVGVIAVQAVFGHRLPHQAGGKNAGTLMHIQGLIGHHQLHVLVTGGAHGANRGHLGVIGKHRHQAGNAALGDDLIQQVGVANAPLREGIVAGTGLDVVHHYRNRALAVGIVGRLFQAGERVGVQGNRGRLRSRRRFRSGGGGCFRGGGRAAGSEQARCQGQHQQQRNYTPQENTFFQNVVLERLMRAGKSAPPYEKYCSIKSRYGKDENDKKVSNFGVNCENNRKSSENGR